MKNETTEKIIEILKQNAADFLYDVDEHILDLQTANNIADKVSEISSQEIQKLIKELTQLILEDVPHQYQKRILEKLKEETKI